MSLAGLKRNLALLLIAFAVVALRSESAAAQPEEHPLDLSVPESMLLGQDTSATISVKDPGEPVRFFTNVGSIASATARGGTLEAVYSPPTERFPQMAIIVAANSDYSLLDWTVLPLHGQPTIKIESIKRAKVVAIVGGQRFGPILTNGRGQAKIQIIAPPGVSEVDLETTDRLGGTSQSSTPLNPPEFSRLLALCPTGEGDDLLVFVSEDTGAPAAKAELVITSSAQAEAPRLVRPGVFAARIAAGGADDAEEVQVSVSLVGTSNSQSSCVGKRPGALPESLALRLSRASFAAGQEAVEVVLVPTYPAGARRRTPRLELEVDFGTVASLVREGDEYRATWTLPNALEARAVARVIAHSLGSKRVTQSNSITLEPGPASVVELKSQQRDLRGDGKSRTKIVASVYDAFGNATTGAVLEGRGQAIGDFKPTGEPGQYVAIYGPVVAYEARDDMVSVRETSTGSTETMSIHFLPMKRRAVADLRLGYATNFGAIRAPSAMLSFGYRTPLLDDSVIVGGTAGFYRSNTSEMAETSELDLEMLGVPVFATASYEHELTVAKLYAGVGGGLVYADTTLSSDESGKHRVRKARPAGGAFLGTRVLAGPGHVVLQAAYWVAPIEDESISGNLLGVTVDLGYGFEI